MSLIRLTATLAVAATAALPAALPLSLAAQQIDTGAPVGGAAANGFGQLNPSQASLVGQTFVAPQYTQLDRFSFFLSDSRSFGLTSYHAFVAAYDGATDMITGPILWQSPARLGTASELPVETTFEIAGGLSVLPGQRYIAFLGTPSLAGSFTQQFGAAYRTTSVAANGLASRVSTAYPGTVASYAGMRWSAPANESFAFRADFSHAAQPVSTVPEPATVLLLAGGLLGTAVVARRRRRRRMPVVAALAAAALLAGAPRRAAAETITLGQWYTFSFGNTGSLAQSGIGSTPAAPWQFTAASDVRVRVTDGQATGDAFSLLDHGTLVGSTSLMPTGAGGCSSNVQACWDNPNMSHGTFDLAAGAHALTIRADRSAYGGGLGYFRVDAVAAPVSTVPEPATVGLLGAGLAAVGTVAARRRR